MEDDDLTLVEEEDLLVLELVDEADNERACTYLVGGEDGKDAFADRGLSFLYLLFERSPQLCSRWSSNDTADDESKLAFADEGRKVVAVRIFWFEYDGYSSVIFFCSSFATVAGPTLAILLLLKYSN